MYNSSDLEDDSDEDGNPHGFVYSHNLDTFRRSKKERLEKQLNERETNKEEHRQKYQKNHDKKKGGETNKKKLKHKPFSMIKLKKLKTVNDKLQNTKTKLKKLKTQLGKYKKNQKQKFDNRKKKLGYKG